MPVRSAHHPESRPDGDDGVARPAAGEVRSRALLVSAGWWLAAAAVYLVVAFSAEGAPPGCRGVQCLNTQGLLLVMGMFVGLPVMLVGMALSTAVIVVRSRSARSGLVLGTQATGAAIGVVLALAAIFALATF
ncbi:hypothetical protein AB0F72_25705 [Actinoplanes sp. NPDC023936]|uniref:hypothetical protein n=1 Tax=Actinoplanes sp. NPDC023936 TaxID=3154910 RepID=UPI003410D4B4